MRTVQPRCIFITPRAYRKLRIYVECCPVEIGGLGNAECREDRLVVSDLFLVEQRASPSETVLDTQRVVELISEYLVQGKDPASLRVWWHSHGETEVYWSPTDEETISTFPGEYLISIVGNRRGQFLCRLDSFARAQETIVGLDLVPLDEPTAEGACGTDAQRRAVLREIREKVRIFLPLDPVELQEWMIAMETQEFEVDLDRFHHDQDQEGL